MRNVTQKTDWTAGFQLCKGQVVIAGSGYLALPVSWAVQEQNGGQILLLEADPLLAKR